MASYSKADVDLHSEGYGRGSRPAVNVKVYGDGPYNAVKTLEERGVDSDTAQQAVDYAVESACERFWEDAQTDAETVFGSGVKVYSEGRSGGWLVVHGLPDFDTWDAIMLGRWRKFEKWMKDAVNGATSEDILLEHIEANRWAEPHAERFNFIETKDGRYLCVADLNRAVAEAAEEARRRFLESA